MFYMLTNIHNQIITGEELSSPHYFWYVLQDIPYRIQNTATSFQLKWSVS